MLFILGDNYASLSYWRAVLSLDGYKTMEIVEDYLRRKGVRFNVTKISSLDGNVRIAKYKISPFTSIIVVNNYYEEESEVYIPLKYKELIEQLSIYKKAELPRIQTLEDEYYDTIINFQKALNEFKNSSFVLLMQATSALLGIFILTLIVHIINPLLILLGIIPLLPLNAGTRYTKPGVFAIYYYFKIKKLREKVKELEVSISPERRISVEKSLNKCKKHILYYKIGIISWLLVILIAILVPLF